MRSFTDSKNRTIELSITVGSVNRVKGALGLNLAKFDERTAEGFPLVAALAGLDVCLIVDVLYWVCKPDLDRLGVDQEAFAEAMAGEAIGRAQDALLAEWSDFFRGLNRPETVTAIEKGRALIRKTFAAADAKAQSMLSDENQAKLIAGAFSQAATESGEPSA